MRLLIPFWRLALVGAAALCLGLAPGCKSKGGDNAVPEGYLAVTGTVTYTRIPLAYNASGVPLGLETDSAKYTTPPARGVVLRFWQSSQEPAPDGTKVTVWKVAATTATGTDGTYTVNVLKDTPTFAELIAQTGSVRIIADPAGINSGVNAAERVFYVLRKGLDGSSGTNKLPATQASANVTLNWAVGLADKWWLGVPTSNTIDALTQETQGTGSRVLAILDSVYAFSANYGRVTPEDGTTLDLHYRPGISEAKGSYVEYNKTAFPQAFDGTSLHYFGSIRGGAANDDAWDEGVLFPILARNYMANRTSLSLPPVGQKLVDLTPEAAIAEGFVDAMAANLLKSPYLADTTPAGVAYRDIRDLTGLSAAQKTPVSAPAIAALSWELVLKGNGLASPGTATTWTNINPLALVRFFTPKYVYASDGTTITDTESLYSQLLRLSESKSASDPVDLAPLFPDSVLTPLLAPFNVPWPRPTTGAYAGFLTNWGTDPNSATTVLPVIPLTMAKAVQVNGVYPNASFGEVAFAQFLLDKDIAYNFAVQTSPAVLPAGTSIEISLPTMQRTFTFTGTTAAQRLLLTGNSTTPVLYFVRVRLVSPTTVAPDVQVALQFVPMS